MGGWSGFLAKERHRSKWVSPPGQGLRYVALPLILGSYVTSLSFTLYYKR
jgi:hypothetical protein